MVETAHRRARIHAGIKAVRINDGDRVRVVAESQNAIAIVALNDGTGAGDGKRSRNAAFIYTKRDHGSRGQRRSGHGGSGHGREAENVALLMNILCVGPGKVSAGTDVLLLVCKTASLLLSITVMVLSSGLKTRVRRPSGDSSMSPGPEVILTVERESVSVRLLPGAASTILSTGL